LPTSNSPYELLFKAVAGFRDISEAWEAQKECKAMQTALIADWQAHGLDAVICPALPVVAVPRGYPEARQGTFTYLNVFNLLDFPAGTLPVTSVTAADEAALDSYPTRSPLNLQHKRVKQAMKGTVGLPVNIQVVTLPWREELCLRVMKDIEIGVKSSQGNKS